MRTLPLADFFEAHVENEAADFRFIALKELLIELLRGRGKQIADVGCGTGMMVRELWRAGFDAWGLEPDPKVLAIAERVRTRSSGRYGLTGGGIDSLTTQRLARVDNVLLLDVLEHLEDDRAMFEHLVGAMAVGARLIFTVPAGVHLYGERDRAIGHYRRYDVEGVRSLLRDVPLRDVELRHWNLLGVPAYFFFERVLHRPVPEGFRLEKPTLARRALNRALLAWFRAFESRVSAPLGLSIVVAGTKGEGPRDG